MCLLVMIYARWTIFGPLQESFLLPCLLPIYLFFSFFLPPQDEFHLTVFPFLPLLSNGLRPMRTIALLVLVQQCMTSYPSDVNPSFVLQTSVLQHEYCSKSEANMEPVQTWRCYFSFSHYPLCNFYLFHNDRFRQTVSPACFFFCFVLKKDALCVTVSTLTHTHLGTDGDKRQQKKRREERRRYRQRQKHISPREELGSSHNFFADCRCRLHGRDRVRNQCTHQRGLAGWAGRCCLWRVVLASTWCHMWSRLEKQNKPIFCQNQPCALIRHPDIYRKKPHRAAEGCVFQCVSACTCALHHVSTVV